jgi:hypothetical protein
VGISKMLWQENRCKVRRRGKLQTAFSTQHSAFSCGEFGWGRQGAAPMICHHSHWLMHARIASSIRVAANSRNSPFGCSAKQVLGGIQSAKSYLRLGGCIKDALFPSQDSVGTTSHLNGNQPQGLKPGDLSACRTANSYSDYVPRRPRRPICVAFVFSGFADVIAK